MSSGEGLTLRNGEAVAVNRLPVHPVQTFRNKVIDSVRNGSRVVALYGVPECRLIGRRSRSGNPIRLIGVLARDAESELEVLTTVVRNAYPSITTECVQAHLFEREIHEQWGVVPKGHPWLKPVRAREINAKDFFIIEGDETHQVAVGPVHAGIIEPGHFRFQCHGENVHHLEIALGYQHRGIERAMVNGPMKRLPHYAETLAGDTTTGHATAYAQIEEAFTGLSAPPRAASIRSIALELERLANHTGDLGAMAGDVGFLPTASYCGRLRGDFLNLTAMICGSRFGRGLVVPGGVGFDADARLADLLVQQLNRIEKDATTAVQLLWKTSSVMARFENTGTLSQPMAMDLGLVGLSARSCGLKRDVRVDFPLGIYPFAHIPVSVWDSGDVFARAFVRWLEIQRSIDFVREQTESIPETEIRIPVKRTRKRLFSISLVEGWRGEICHAAVTDDSGHLVHYKVVDPSFHNWFGLAMAMRGQPVSDFPLCNKSFNLSYCGHDL